MARRTKPPPDESDRAIAEAIGVGRETVRRARQTQTAPFGAVTARTGRDGKTRKMPLAAWIERNIRLPEGTAAKPGKITLHPYQRAWCDALTDPAVERVTVMKSARVGYTVILTALIAYHVAEEPAAVLCLLPTQDDCRDFVVSDIEACFDGSPSLAGRLSGPKKGGDRINRNTITHRLFKGGSLKVVAGKAPRNLRRHSARVLLIDECDAIEASAEGDPISLAEKRTLAFANRRIVCGSTPLDESTSHIARLFAQSDQSVWEVPCPACGAFAELRWEAIEWPPDAPELAAWRCPHCRELIDAAHRPQMALGGRWRALRPGATGHRGFRISALASLLPGAAWGKLAAEFVVAKDDPATLRVFCNTVLGEPWRADGGDELDDADLASRTEPFSLEDCPAAVLALTAGVDVQHDRLEATVCGWSRDGGCYVLAHHVLWGATDDAGAEVWRELDHLLRMRWPHPAGGSLKIDAACVDGGDGGMMDIVGKFCGARLGRRVFCIKGASGFARASILKAKIKRGPPLFIVGVDAIKARLFDRLAKGRSIRFSGTLPGEWFEQLTSERRMVRMARGKPMVRFERKPGYAAEALDCVIYAHAAKAALTLNFDQREAELRSPVPPTPPPSVIRSQWMQR